MVLKSQAAMGKTWKQVIYPLYPDKIRENTRIHIPKAHDFMTCYVHNDSMPKQGIDEVYSFLSKLPKQNCFLGEK